MDEMLRQLGQIIVRGIAEIEEWSIVGIYTGTAGTTQTIAVRQDDGSAVQVNLIAGRADLRGAADVTEVTS